MHNASGALGRLFPYIVRSHFTTLGAGSTALATFDGDESAAVVRTAVGQGQVTQFGFLPASPYPFLDAYDPQPDFNRGPIDGSVPYLLDFLDRAGAVSKPPILLYCHTASRTASHHCQLFRSRGVLRVCIIRRATAGASCQRHRGGRQHEDCDARGDTTAGV